MRLLRELISCLPFGAQLPATSYFTLRAGRAVPPQGVRMARRCHASPKRHGSAPGELATQLLGFAALPRPVFLEHVMRIRYLDACSSLSLVALAVSLAVSQSACRASAQASCAEFNGTRASAAALLTSIQDQDIDGLRRALACGADPNGTDDGKSVLWYAIQRGNVILVRELVKAGADARHRLPDPDKTTMLGAAASAGNPWVVDALLKAGAGPNERTGQGSMTPLGVAAMMGNATACDFLIRAGADPNSRNLLPGSLPDAGVGRTPLMLAASRGHASTVGHLLYDGADPALKDSKGQTASDLASEFVSPVPQIRNLLARPPVPLRPKK